MKFFQKLLVAPAALGLIAPVAANAGDLSLQSVSDYSSTRSARVSSTKRVKGASQFSDVYPTDWSFQALTRMLERHSCAPATNSGSMTRYEAAALLNSCLSNVAQANEEERRLINEFSAEIAVIKGSLNGVEAGMASVGSSEFSTTTVLEGQTTFAVSTNSFDGSKPTSIASFPDNGVNEAQANFGGTALSYDIQLALTTSFNGEDTLVTIMRAGDFGDMATGGSSAPHALGTLEYASSSSNYFTTDKVYYQRPFGSFTVTAGARVGQEDMLAIWPTAYQSDSATTVLDVNTVAGAPGAYHKNLGSGVGVSWLSDGGFAVSASYVANEDTAYSADADSGGFMTDGSKGSSTVQLGYTTDQWGIAGVYSHLTDSSLIGYTTKFLSGKLGGTGDDGTDAYGISGYWMPEEAGFVPSISLGYGWNTHDTTTTDYAEESSSWTLGLEWSDVGVEGNAAGLAIGSAVSADSMKGGASVEDENTVFEIWYKHQVSDGIVVSPALYWLGSPRGDNDSGKSHDFDQLGAVLRTTFTF